MEHQGPGTGRRPEDIAQEIIDSSDEGMDGLLHGTEITEGDDFETDDAYRSDLPQYDDYGDDDGGDYTDF